MVKEKTIMEITRDTVIGEIVANCPEAMPVFQEIGMHCIGCALASGETLEQACAAHGVDPDEFLDYLQKYLETI
jgi:hybrid cluster-associated redox disulfide protein